MGKFAESLAAKKQTEYAVIEVDEWGDDKGPLKIYHTPFTLADLKKIRKHAKEDNLETIVYTLIFKAMDEQGNPLFDLDDKFYLMNSEDSEFLSKIVQQMNESDSFEQAVKNS